MPAKTRSAMSIFSGSATAEVLLDGSRPLHGSRFVGLVGLVSLELPGWPVVHRLRLWLRIASAFLEQLEQVGRAKPLLRAPPAEKFARRGLTAPRGVDRRLPDELFPDFHRC